MDHKSLQFNYTRLDLANLETQSTPQLLIFILFPVVVSVISGSFHITVHSSFQFSDQLRQVWIKSSWDRNVGSVIINSWWAGTHHVPHFTSECIASFAPSQRCQQTVGVPDLFATSAWKWRVLSGYSHTWMRRGSQSPWEMYRGASDLLTAQHQSLTSL